MKKTANWNCQKCKKKVEILWSFMPYGNHPRKKDEKEYCKVCFDKLWADGDEKLKKK